ncbi:MAG: BTAD domain-containing putative transcriptional regulator [Gemmatimonadales bacterium]
MLRLRTFGGLWIEAEDGTRVPPPRPRRLALLAILAAAGPRGVSRARLRAMFWPDADDERARHSLSQTLYALRRDLGLNPVTSAAELRLDVDAITTDTDQFRDAVARSDWPSAALHYQGPFAAGFGLDDAPEFNRWLDEARAVLARDAEAAIVALARDAEAAGDLARAAEAHQRLTVLAPLSAGYALSYMSALLAMGDRAGALAHAKHHSALVRAELECEPDPTITELTERLRLEAQPPPARGTASAPSVEVGFAESGWRDRRRSPVRHSFWPSTRRFWLGGLAGLTLAAVVAVLAQRAGSGERAPVLAVGQIRDLTAPDSAQLGGVLSEVVATSLARIGGLEVIANSRIIELLAPGRDTLRAARTDAARRAGATEVIEGELVPAGGGQLRLDLRRIDLRRGALRGGYSVSGSDRFGLIDSVTSLVAADLETGPPLRSLAEVTPQSPIALRLYEEGLRAYYQSDNLAAERLFREAISEDSTFAMAAYYAYRVVLERSQRDPDLETRALRLATRASDRDRLVIVTSIGFVRNDPVAVVFADSLATRFPRDPEALLRAAEALLHHRNTPAERSLLERAVAIDSAAQTSPRAPCRLCAALKLLGWELAWADSGAAAVRTYQRWVALRPGDPAAIHELALQQFILGQYEAGARTIGLLASLPSDQGFDGGGRLFLGRLLTGRLDEADAECMVQLRREGDLRSLRGFTWACPIVWRNQGRYRDAYALVVAGRVPGGGQVAGEHRPDPIGEVVLDLEMNRPILALRTLENSVPVVTPDVAPGVYARDLTWSLIRRGTVAAMAREFELARRLADSAELIGRSSLFGRDPLLHSFVRGLVAQSSGDHQTAVDFFRRSVFSWTFGYTRVNLELARSLLALGRPAEAVGPLRSALRGGWDGSNLYVTRTELHEVLAQAFAAAGNGDSAAVHYAAVEQAWRGADPDFAARYQAARDWLARNGAAP